MNSSLGCTGPPAYREIPGGPAVVKIIFFKFYYYKNKFIIKKYFFQNIVFFGGRQYWSPIWPKVDQIQPHKPTMGSNGGLPIAAIIAKLTREQKSTRPRLSY